MQARRAARELALILFSQFDKKITQYNQAEFEDIILKSVRTLTNNAIDELKTSVGSINAMKEFVDNCYRNYQGQRAVVQDRGFAFPFCGEEQRQYLVQSKCYFDYRVLDPGPSNQLSNL